MNDLQAMHIVRYPDPILLRMATPIEAVTEEVRAVAGRMIELMHAAKGVGLAAPQVGLSWRMFVTNAGEDDVDRVYVNPRLFDPEGALEAHEEGCLSIPDVLGEVRRVPIISIRASDLDGKEFEMRGEDLLARVWQHENDHLDGRLIIHRFGQMARLANRRILRDMERQAKAG